MVRVNVTTTALNSSADQPHLPTPTTDLRRCPRRVPRPGPRLQGACVLPAQRSRKDGWFPDAVSRKKRFFPHATRSGNARVLWVPILGSFGATIQAYHPLSVFTHDHSRVRVGIVLIVRTETTDDARPTSFRSVRNARAADTWNFSFRRCRFCFCCRCLFPPRRFRANP